MVHSAVVHGLLEAQLRKRKDYSITSVQEDLEWIPRSATHFKGSRGGSTPTALKGRVRGGVEQILSVAIVAMVSHLAQVGKPEETFT